MHVPLVYAWHMLPCPRSERPLAPLVREFETQEKSGQIRCLHMQMFKQSLERVISDMSPTMALHSVV